MDKSKLNTFIGDYFWGKTTLSHIFFTGCGTIYLILTIVLEKSIQYSGFNLYVFSAFSFLLLMRGILGKRSYFFLFISILLFLGSWMKFFVIMYFNARHFREPIGEFSFTHAQLSAFFTLFSSAFAGFLGASLLQRFSFNSLYDSRWNNIKCDHRKKLIIYILFILLVLIISISNLYFGFYQRGCLSRTILPFGLNKIVIWLVLFGLASFNSVILFINFKIGARLFLIFQLVTFETFFSSISMLSRGMIINASSFFASMYDQIKYKKIRTLLYMLVPFFLFFIFSIKISNALRSNFYDDAGFSVNAFQNEIFHDSSNRSPFLELMIDRWVGAEGAMSVIAFPRKSWSLFFEAIKEVKGKKISFYDKTFVVSQYNDADFNKFSFINIPGLVGFLFYPGSFLFVFFGCLIFGLIGYLLERIAFRLSYSNIFFSSLIGQVVAYRFAHFGNFPAQSYLLFGMIILNSFIVYWLTPFALKYIGKEDNIGLPMSLDKI